MSIDDFSVFEIPDSSKELFKEYPSLVQTVLYKAGLKDEEDIEEFLNPVFEKLSDPFAFSNMKKAVKRIVQAIKLGEGIAIYADYDADGVPGAAVLYEALKKLNLQNQIEVYIPHRHNEGYGFHIGAIDYLKQKSTHLIITVDVGITAVEEVAYAQMQGIDVIVTDHHEAGSGLPSAFTIVNPKADTKYPDDRLCGAAVAFQLVRGLYQYLREKPMDGVVVPSEGWEKWLLDLVGMATLSDMVPLLGENRILAHYGLVVLQKSKRPGIKALCEAKRIFQPKLTEQDVVFRMTPLLNAASRMGHPRQAFALLTAKTVDEAAKYAGELNVLNDKRKTTTATITKQIHKRVEQSPSLVEKPFLVMGHDEWHLGVVGLAASKIVERYGVTAFVWARDDSGDIKGSCRAAGNVNVHTLMHALPDDTFVHFGGHAGAGGFSVQEHAIIDLPLRIEKVWNKAVTNGDDEIGDIELDAVLTPAQCTKQLVDSVKVCAPFGVANELPLIGIKGIVSQIKKFGSGNIHTRIVLGDIQNGQTIECSVFYAGEKPGVHEITEGKECVVVGNLEYSVFRGIGSVKCIVRSVLV